MSENGSISEALCGWAAKADDSFVCFGAKLDKFLDRNLAVSGSGKGTRKRVDDATPERGSWRWTAESKLALDSRESWRGTTDRGSQHRTPETVGDKIGSSEDDRLKMSAFEVLGEFSLVNHASDSPHMHIVLQYLFSALG